MKIHILNTLRDNFTYILEPANPSDCLIIDPGESKPILEYMHLNKLRPTWIFNTHHHGDHSGGNSGLKTAFPGIEVAASKTDSFLIPQVTYPLTSATSLAWSPGETQLIFTPGHTEGQVCLYLPGEKAIFTGDTLFLFGCGKNLKVPQNKCGRVYINCQDFQMTP